MHWLVVWYFRMFDRSLGRPAAIAADPSEPGEWNAALGEMGEALAARWLWVKGLKVLYRNYRAPSGGEVDIVARHGETLVFCEVKTRSSDQFGRPAAAVDEEKRRLIARGATGWLRELRFPPVVYRFDIVEVILEEGEIPEIHHIESAFQTGGMHAIS